MNKFAIYTAIIGSYDEIQQPLVTDNDFDYILYVDNVSCYEEYVGVWKVLPIKYHSEDKTRIARYVKTHSHELLPEYEATLWVDSNIVICSQYIYDKVKSLHNEGVKVAAVRHPWRDCIYEEAYMVMSFSLDREDVVFSWCHFLRREDYPRHNGLCETGILFRRRVGTEGMNRLWWNCIEKYSRRDQLSFNYVLWKLGLEYSCILPIGENVRSSQTCKFYGHHNVSKEQGRHSFKESTSFHFRNRCRLGMDEKIKAFQEFHYWLYGLQPIIAKIILYLWGYTSMIVYGPIIKYRAWKKHK